MKRNFTLKVITALLGCLLVTSCSNDDEEDWIIGPDPKPYGYGWSEVMQGNDPEEITWPDLSENYWEYTMDVSYFAEQEALVGLRFSGTFPTDDTRFFNITLYDDNSTKRIASIEDFNIKPAKGSKNPFAEAGVSGKNYFEVNAVPEGTSEKMKGSLSNVLEFPDKTKRLSVLLRIYFNSTDHDGGFGGVDLPKLEFVNMETGKVIGEAVRAKSNYYAACSAIVSSIPPIAAVPALVFTLAPDLMYSNGPTGYVTAANRLQVGEALLFRFLPPVHPNNVLENKDADVRYWSICVGDLETHTPRTVPDREIVKSDDGYVNFIIVDEADPYLTAIKAKAKAMKINLITWDGKTFGDGMMVFYRQMYIRDGYEYSVQKLPAYPPLNSIGLPDSSAPIKPENMAHIGLGEHGPSGLKLPSGVILTDDFDYSYMRLPAQAE